MITTLDELTIIWQKLKGYAPLATDSTKITGGFYKQKRPAGSTKEDIVVNGLGINNEQLQAGIINVNIHVPNVPVNTGSLQDTTQPNLVRLKQLTDFAVVLLNDVWVGDYHYHVQQQNLFEDDDGSNHYSNIRLEFFNINL